MRVLFRVALTPIAVLLFASALFAFLIALALEEVHSRRSPHALVRHEQSLGLGPPRRLD